MREFKRAIVLLIISLVLSSCTPIPTSDNTAITEVEDDHTVKTTLTKIPSPAPLYEDAPRGGILKIGYFSPITSADGFQAIGGFERMVFFTSNEPLVAIGKHGKYDAAESLAYAFEILDEGQRVRFFLREGVQFQDGYGVMTADDVAWSLNRIHDPEGGFGAPGLFRNFQFAEVVDDYTVDILLDSPDANMVSKLFERSSLVHSKTHWDSIGGADNHKSAPIGTGPYKVDKWNVGSDIQYTKHDDWWRGSPYADGVIVTVVREPRTRLALLQTGSLHVAWLQAEIVPVAYKDSNLQVWPFKGVGFDSWIHTNGLAPFDDIRIRRAAVKAINADDVNTAIYLNTMAANHKWHTFAPPSPFAVDLSESWESELKYDPHAARKLVEEYAEENGLTLPLTIKGVCERRPDRLQFCELIQSLWGNIGLNFEFEIVATPADRARIMAECETHVSQGGSGILFPFQIDRALHSAGWYNYASNTALCKGNGQIADETVQTKLDSLLDSAAMEFDPERQAELYREAQYIALKNVWVYPPLLLRVNYIACHVTTGGCDKNPHRADGFIRAGDFWIKRE